MNAFLSPLALGALLVFPNLHAQGNAPAAVDLQITDIDRVAVAGEPVRLSFSVFNNASRPIDKIVAVPFDPTGREMTARNMHTRDIQAGQSLAKDLQHGLPEGSLPGTYRLDVRALAADGEVLGMAQTAFDLLNFTEALDANGLSIEVSDVPAHVETGQDVRVRVAFTNRSARTVERVFAMVQRPSGSLMNARGIFRGTIGAGETFDRLHREGIPVGSQPGTYRVQFQVLCDDGTLVATAPASFEVTASTAGLRASEPLAAFPNPAADRATLRFALATEAEGSLSIYDALGRVVSTPVRGTVNAGRTETDVDVSAYAPGLYVARLAMADGSTQVTRFTVAR